MIYAILFLLAPCFYIQDGRIAVVRRSHHQLRARIEPSPVTSRTKDTSQRPSTLTHA